MIILDSGHERQIRAELKSTLKHAKTQNIKKCYLCPPGLGVITEVSLSPRLQQNLALRALFGMD